MKAPKITYENFMDLCKTSDIQPNHLFACLRKTLGVSQAKLAYRLDNEHINQNSISRYEHKNIIDAEYEYILWKWAVKEMNSYSRPTKSGSAVWMSIYVAAVELYILRYASKKQSYQLQAAMIMAIKGFAT